MLVYCVISTQHVPTEIRLRLSIIGIVIGSITLGIYIGPRNAVLCPLSTAESFGYNIYSYYGHIYYQLNVEYCIIPVIGIHHHG